jgi:hypothetical protein
VASCATISPRQSWCRRDTGILILIAAAFSPRSPSTAARPPANSSSCDICDFDQNDQGFCRFLCRRWLATRCDMVASAEKIRRSGFLTWSSRPAPLPARRLGGVGRLFDGDEAATTGITASAIRCASRINGVFACSVLPLRLMPIFKSSGDPHAIISDNPAVKML